MLPDPATQPDPDQPSAPPDEAETHVQATNPVSAHRLRNIAHLAEIIDVGMGQVRQAQLKIDQAFELTQSGEPAPKGPDPAIEFHRALGGITRAMAMQDRLEQNTALPGRSPADQARDAARAIRRHQEERRSEIRHKLDSTLPNIPQNQARSVRRDIEEMLAGDEISDLLESETTADLVLKICEDLGLKPDLSKWTDEEIGYVPQLQPLPKSDLNWVPVVNASGLTNYFAGPPLKTEPEPEPTRRPYGFPDP
jgi:hypothetical protein